MLGINMIDMLPNATLMPFTWLIAGALLGYAEALGRSAAPTTRGQLRRSRAGAQPRPASCPAANNPATRTARRMPLADRGCW